MTQELLNYFNGDEMASQVWWDKYALQETEVTPDDMHKRLAKEYARIEAKYCLLPEEDFHYERLSEYGKTRADYHAVVGTDNPNPIEQFEKGIYELFKDFKYIIPAGSIMANLGKDTPTSLSNCFFLGQPDDNIESIFNYARDSAQLFKRRGGVGNDLSLLRPNGAGVKNASNSSTGPVSFMNIYDATTKTIGQDGRRAALMLSLDIRHPDSPEFVKCKEDKTKITAANISLKIGKDFMEAVTKDEDYFLHFPIDYDISAFTDRQGEPFNQLTEHGFYKEDGLMDIVYIKRIRAKELWNSICQHAHDDAEPGLLFWDNHLEYDPAAVYPEYCPIGTNPCGEVPLSYRDSCRLSAINLYSFVDTPFTTAGKNPSINYKKLYEVSYEQLVLSDDLVDLEIEAIDKILGKINSEYYTFLSIINRDKIDTTISRWLQEQSDEFKLWWNIRENGRKGRRVGNGFTALADMIAAMNMSYGSEESMELIQEVMHTKMQAELDASIDLSILRGSFTEWNSELEFITTPNKISGVTISGINDFYETLIEWWPDQVERMRQYGRRNVSISTVAPTGTTSLMTQTTSGIEPLFQAVYKRRIKVEEGKYDFESKDGQKFKEYIVVHPKLKDFARNGLGYLQEFFDKLTKDEWNSIYKQSPYYNSCANDINWKQRIDLQALVQIFTSHSISSTLNLPKSTTVDEINQIYLYANEKKLKGITVYVEGSREGILVNNKPNKGIWSPSTERRAPERPKMLPAKLTPIKSKGIRYAVIIGFLEDKPYEIFAYELTTDEQPVNGHIIKIKKGVYNFISSNYTVHNLELANDKIEEKACTLFSSMLLREGADINHVIKTAKKVDDNITSFASAMCRVLAKYAPKHESGELCPECGQPLQHTSGCISCPSCSFSKCLLMYKFNTNK